MPRISKLSKNSSGLYLRNLGWKRTATGFTQPKFYLGDLEKNAERINSRLEAVWDQVKVRWRRSHPEQHKLAATNRSVKVVPVNSPTGNAQVGNVIVMTGLSEPEGKDRAVWDETTLAIAKAVCNGEPVAFVPLERHLKCFGLEHPAIGYWLSELQSDFKDIKIELAEPEAQTAATTSLQTEGQRLVTLGHKLMKRRSSEQKLHEVLVTRIKWIEKKYVGPDQLVTQWGRNQVRCLTFVKDHLPNHALSELNSHRIEEMVELLRLRPVTKFGKPASVKWIRTCIRQFHNCLKWLHRAPEFDWQWPVDLQWPSVNVSSTPAEKSARARTTQVVTYTTEEIKILWQYATPMQRTMMLLALNCGFGAAENASLELADVHLHSPHPSEKDLGIKTSDRDSWIRRVRIKTTVYGEWNLWPETVFAIKWWLGQRRSIAESESQSTLFITNTGERYDAVTSGNNPNQQIRNHWKELTAQVRKDQEDFRQLSFNKLRKTASSRIRAIAGGEISSIFLCHGTPLKHDELVEVYANRPFAKVFAAINEMGTALRPLFADFESAFPLVPKKGGPNISKGKLHRIRLLLRSGMKQPAIAKELGISKETVRRRANELRMEKQGE